MIISEQYDHIGIAVRNVDDTVDFFIKKLGAQLATKKYLYKPLNIYIAEVVLGKIKLEFIEDADPNGPVAKFIEKRGEGFHHISILVDDITKEARNLESRGVELTGKKIEPPGDKWFYVSLKQSFGAMIQYWEWE